MSDAASIIDEFAQMHIDYEHSVTERLERRSDEALAALLASVREHQEQTFGNNRFTRTLADLIESEQIWRYHLRKAKSLGADAYCVAHECATDKCPRGAHDD